MGNQETDRLTERGVRERKVKRKIGRGRERVSKRRGEEVRHQKTDNLT